MKIWEKAQEEEMHRRCPSDKIFREEIWKQYITASKTKLDGMTGPEVNIIDKSLSIENIC